MTRTRTLTAAAMTGIAALALTACGTTDVAAPSTEGDAVASQSCADDTTETATGAVSLTDSLGRTVELDAPAERVAVLEWQQTEDLLSLCVTPIGAAPNPARRPLATAQERRRIRLHPPSGERAQHPPPPRESHSWSRGSSRSPA